MVYVESLKGAVAAGGGGEGVEVRVKESDI